jgi:hypothetical protein
MTLYLVSMTCVVPEILPTKRAWDPNAVDGLVACQGSKHQHCKTRLQSGKSTVTWVPAGNGCLEYQGIEIEIENLIWPLPRAQCLEALLCSIEDMHLGIWHLPFGVNVWMSN